MTPEHVICKSPPQSMHLVCASPGSTAAIIIRYRKTHFVISLVFSSTTILRFWGVFLFIFRCWCCAMPLNCVVGGCTRNWVKNPDVFWLIFPKNVTTRRAWVRFVNNTRSDFTLTNASRVCSAHFSEDCIDETVRMKISLGLKTRFQVKEGSVPTIKAPTLASGGTSTVPFRP